jgi:cytochrome c oxidase assembly factor CtaG
MDHDMLPRPSLGTVLLGPPDWVGVTVCAVLALAYLAAQWRLQWRGDSWPWRRTAAWLGGVVVLYLVTATGFSSYAMVLFSAHMAQHMVLSMYAPGLLVLGAPVTLLLRALPARGRGSGPRRALIRLLHTRTLRVVSSLPMAVALFVVSLFGLYFTPAFSFLMSSMVGHRVMQLHFLVTGYLFFWTIAGTDPGPRRPAEPIRLLTLLPVNALHAFFAVIVIFSQVVLGQPYLGRVHPPWISLLHDQAIGGAIAAGTAEVPIAGIAVPLFLRWMSDLQRRGRAGDRPATSYVARAPAPARRSPDAPGRRRPRRVG